MNRGHPILAAILLTWSVGYAAEPERPAAGVAEATDKNDAELLEKVKALVIAGKWQETKEIAYRRRKQDPLYTRKTIWPSLGSDLNYATGYKDDPCRQTKYRAQVAETLGLHDLSMRFHEEHVRLSKTEHDRNQAEMDATRSARRAALTAMRQGDYASAKKYYRLVEKHGTTWVKELGAKKASQVAEFAKDPSEVEARIELATTFWVGRFPGAGQYYVDAIALLEEILTLSPPPSPEHRQRIYSLIGDYYLQSGDAAKAKAWSERLLEEFPSGKKQVAETYVKLGQKAYSARDLPRALEHYSHVRDTFADTPSYGVAQFNVGLILKQQGKLDEAIEQFRELLRSDVNDLDPGGDIMTAYRNYHPRAQWEIGHCLFAKGDYRGALEAYRTTQTKYPFQSWCGNAHAEFAYRYGFYQGVCLEHLGDTPAATGCYYRAITDGGDFYFHPAAHRRLVDLYEAGGKLDVWVSILDQMDARFVKQSGAQLDPKMAEEERRKMLPSGTMRNMIDMRWHAAEENWSELVAKLKARGTVAGPEEAYARRGNWPAVDAARLLAARPEQTSPLMLAALKEAKYPDTKWICYALGRCATPAAPDHLEQRASDQRYYHCAQSLIYGLSLAGPRGEALIDELAGTDGGNLRRAVEIFRARRVDAAPYEVKFPPIDEDADLPASLADLLNEDPLQADLQSAVPAKDGSNDLTSRQVAVVTILLAVMAATIVQFARKRRLAGPRKT